MAAAAILKNPKTPYLGRGNSDFDEIWHDDAVRLSWHVQLLTILKSKMAAAAIFFKIQKSRYLNCGSIWYNDAVWCSWLFWPLKIWNFENQDGSDVGVSR